MASKRHLKSFLEHIELSVLESHSKELAPSIIQDVVQFNIHRRQLLQQLSHLLVSHKMALGNLFSMIPHYMGMYAMYVGPNSTHRCYVSDMACSRGRYVVLCQKLQPNTPHSDSFSFFVRTDIFQYVRFFYFLTHINFYVTRLVLDTTYSDRWDHNGFVDDLHRKYECATRTLMNLVLPLEAI